MFRDAKVGDRVWSYNWGWGNICCIEEMSELPIAVRLDSGTKPNPRFNYDGTGMNYYNSEGKGVGKQPTLFWDEVKIVPPPKPKRKVKKVAEGWINLYDKGVADKETASILHKKKGDAIEYRCPNHVGEPLFIRHEYEVEED